MVEKQELSGLLQKIAYQDDKAAFSKFFKLYHARLIRFALLYVYSYKDAEDVVSEVMIKLLNQRRKLPEIKNLAAYLFTSVKHQAINYSKRNISKSQMHLDDIPKDFLTDNFVQPLELVLEKELREVIGNVVESLPPQRKLVYKMIKDDGLKIKEVAELLEIAEKTVKKHLELGLRNLKEAIEMYYAEKRSTTRVIKMPRDASLLLIACIVINLI